LKWFMTIFRPLDGACSDAASLTSSWSYYTIGDKKSGYNIPLINRCGGTKGRNCMILAF
jgi:hypothetical protein